MEIARRFLIRAETVVTPEGVAVPAPLGSNPGVTVSRRRAKGSVEYLEFALSSRDVEEILIRPLSTAPERADLQRAMVEAGAGAPRRCALVVHAILDLVPAVKAADGVEAPRSGHSIPMTRLSLPELLRALEHPSGYLVPEAGLVYRLVPAPARRRLDQGAFRHYELTRSSWTRRQLEKRLDQVLSTYYGCRRGPADDESLRQLEELGAAGLHAPCALYSGRSLSVRLEAGDRLTLRRIRPRWEVRQGQARRLPDLELEISAETGPHGLPQFCLPVRMRSLPVGRTGAVCLGDWSSNNPYWAASGLEILQRAEEVLLTPWVSPSHDDVKRPTRAQRLGGRHGLRHPRTA